MSTIMAIFRITTKNKRTLFPLMESRGQRSLVNFPVSGQHPCFAPSVMCQVFDMAQACKFKGHVFRQCPMRFSQCVSRRTLVHHGAESFKPKSVDCCNVNFVNMLI